MKNQGEEKPAKKPYVKADLSHHLNMALEIISEKLGNSKSSIVNDALQYYFKNEFREAFPKSEAELRLQAQEQEDLKRYARAYIDKSHAEQWIPKYENEIKKITEKMNRVKGEILKIDNNIKGKQYKSAKELKALKTEKEKLSEQLNFHLKNEMKDNQRVLNDMKKTLPGILND